MPPKGSDFLAKAWNLLYYVIKKYIHIEMFQPRNMDGFLCYLKLGTFYIYYVEEKKKIIQAK